jgi:hypothetical protein
MELIQAREELPWPAGPNSTFTTISKSELNITTLEFFNYTLYSNNTLSNTSYCWLTFQDLDRFELVDNGTFYNVTSCWSPYNGIKQRGVLGIAFATLFTATIMFTLVNLNRHGSMYLPQVKRFRAIGRRWQWYWMLFVAACGLISCVSAVDVDRDYLQNIPIILQNFFFYLMLPGVLATVWEGVRHWSVSQFNAFRTAVLRRARGSWQERQIYDREPFSLPHSDRRARAEFYLPLVFYVFAWLNFFMIIPRNWSPIQSQNTEEQVNDIAEPNATDIRFKAGAILAFCAWLVICYDVQHIIHYYRPRSAGPVHGTFGFLRFLPGRFMLTIPLLLVVIGYYAAEAWIWQINVGKFDVNTAYLFGLGYGPVVMILAINEFDGLMRPNEDRELIRQRLDRGQTLDAELGFDRRVRKPWWWRRYGGEIGMSADDRLKNMVSEIGGGRVTHNNIARDIELSEVPLRTQD